MAFAEPERHLEATIAFVPEESPSSPRNLRCESLLMRATTFQRLTRRRACPYNAAYCERM